MKTPAALALALGLALSAGPALAGSASGQRSVFTTYEDPWRHWGNPHRVGHSGFAGHHRFVGHHGVGGHRHHGRHRFHGHHGLRHHHFPNNHGLGFIHTPDGVVISHHGRIIGVPKVLVPDRHGHVFVPAPTRIFVPGPWAWWPSRGWVWMPGHWTW
jgi:hypothetical protein